MGYYLGIVIIINVLFILTVHYFVLVNTECKMFFGKSFIFLLSVFTAFILLLSFRQWTCESGTHPLHSDQPQGYGLGCGNLQCTGHRPACSAHPLRDLLQEAAPGEKAW